MTEGPRPLQPGDRAPGFTLPAINREAAVRLDDFRGRSAVLIGLFRGLHCPFCRRQIVQLGAGQPGLRAAGVETVAIVTTASCGGPGSRPRIGSPTSPGSRPATRSGRPSAPFRADP